MKKKAPKPQFTRNIDTIINRFIRADRDWREAVDQQANWRESLFANVCMTNAEHYVNWSNIADAKYKRRQILEGQIQDRLPFGAYYIAPGRLMVYSRCPRGIVFHDVKSIGLAKP